MKAIVFDRIGDPEEVLVLRDMPIPEIGENDVLLKMTSASINPGDFLFIQNLYPDPKKPKFPGQIGGNHGAGIIEKKGRQVSLPEGTHVAFSYYNTWAEYAVVPAEWLIPIPFDLPAEKSGQWVNFISAWDLLEQAKLSSGQWLALTAGNSTISILTAQFARLRGINVLSIIRRSQPEVDLRTMGSTAVIELSNMQDSIHERIMGITQNKGINGLIDNVGGPVTGELIRSMGFGGKVIINGGMSPEQFNLHNFDILLSGVQLQAHVYRYFFTPPQVGDIPALQEISRVVGSPGFRVPVGGRHKLEDFRTAISETMHVPEKGKHFFVIRSL